MIVKGLASFFKLPGMCGIVGLPRVRVICKGMARQYIVCFCVNKSYQIYKAPVCLCYAKTQCVPYPFLTRVWSASSWSSQLQG